MVVFWLLAVLMTALALAVVLVPLLRGRLVAGPSSLDANLAILRGQRREIEADVASGVLPASEREEALSELVERARDDLASHEAPASPPRSSRPWLAAAVVAVAMPAIAFGIYAWLGSPGALVPPAPTHEAGKMNDLQIELMVDNLARKVRERPDDARGWSLLARSLAAMGRYDEATEAYEHLNQLIPNDPSVLADYADALGMAQGRSLAGRPYELVKKALAIDPRHRKALALAGTAAMDAGDYAAALVYWQSLAATTEPGSQDEQDVMALLDELRQKAAAAGKPLPAAASIRSSADSAARATSPPKMAKAPAPASAAASASAAAQALTGSVSIAPSVAAKMNPSDTLFVFARAENGPRMPLAVIRTSAAALPMKFSLDDSMAMAPTARLSSASAVRIEARISRSGNALPAPGDLIGMSGVVKPDAHDVKIVIDKVVP